MKDNIKNCGYADSEKEAVVIGWFIVALAAGIIIACPAILVIAAVCLAGRKVCNG